MKLTKQMLHEMIENALKESDAVGNGNKWEKMLKKWIDDPEPHPGGIPGVEKPRQQPPFRDREDYEASKRSNPDREEGLDEAIVGPGLHDLIAGSSLYDIEQKGGIERLLNAAYISGQRNEPIRDLDDGDPWFQEKFLLLQKEWEKGRQWAGEQYPDFAR